MLKDNLADLLKHLEELEGAARTLPNQNFADIVASAKGRVMQLRDHPDVDAVQEKLHGPDQAPLPMGSDQPANLNPSQSGPLPPTTPFPGAQPSDHPSHDAPAFTPPKV